MKRHSIGTPHQSSIYSGVSDTARRQVALAPIALVAAALLSVYAFRDHATQGAGQHSEMASAVSAPVFVSANGYDGDNRLAALSPGERR